MPLQVGERTALSSRIFPSKDSPEGCFLACRGPCSLPAILDLANFNCLSKIDKAFDKVRFSLPKAPLSAPLPTPPPAQKLPPQPILPPIPVRSYLPAPSVKVLEEVEYIQVKKLLRNIRKQPMRQKHRATEAMPKMPRDAGVFGVSGNSIADGNIAVVLGLDIDYGVGSRTASLSICQPRLLPNPEKEEAVLLETFSVREADVMALLLAHYQSVSALVQR